jgi:hypothetical protein
MIIKGIFRVPIFDADIIIIVSDNLLKTINRYYKKHGDTDFEVVEPGALFYSDGNADTPYYLFFHKSNITTEVVNHEKSHLVEEILIDRSIEPIDEIRSYVDGFVSTKINLFFKRRKLKISN